MRRRYNELKLRIKMIRNIIRGWPIMYKWSINGPESNAMVEAYGPNSILAYCSISNVQVARVIRRIEINPNHSLHLKCPTCDVEFFSGVIASPTAKYKAKNSLHSCPNGHRHAYQTKDFFASTEYNFVEQP